MRSLPEWMNARARRENLDEHVDRKHTAHFGLDQMPTGEKEEWVERHFNRVAAKYDFMNTLLSFGIHYLWKRVAVRAMGLCPGDRVLDLCGGTGDLSILASRKVGPQGQVVLCDINRAMIQAGREKKRLSEIRSRLGYVQGNAEALSFPDGSFDAAMVGFGIRNLTHLKQGFREMHRVLRPGGQLMCLEFSKPTWPAFRWLYDIYSFVVMPFLGQLLAGSSQAYACLPETIRMFPLPDELSAILQGIGFTGVSYRRLTNGIAVIHTGKKTVCNTRGKG